jgi:ligand-binding sensor domain-containing protein
MKTVLKFVLLFLSFAVQAQDPIFRSIPIPDSINCINDLYKTIDGNVYVATNKGLYKYFPTIDQFELVYKSNDDNQYKINVIFEFQNSIFYLGSYRSSLIVLDSLNEINEFSFKDLTGKEELLTDINSIDGKIYAATAEGTIAVFNPTTEEFSLMPSPVKSEINAIWKESSGTLWLSSIEGVYSYQKGEWTRSTVFFQAYGLRIKNDEYWVIGRDKEFNAKIMYLYNYKTDVLKLHKKKWADLVFNNLPSEFLRFKDIDFDSNGILWLASNVGVLKYDPYTGYNIWYSNKKYEKFPFNESSHIQVIDDNTILVSYQNKLCKITLPIN